MRDKWNLSRRQFLQTSALGLAGASLTTLPSCMESQKTAANGLPKRKLGKTGLDVTVLSFGGGSQFLRNPDGEWEPILQRAVDLGINLFDTSAGYQWEASMTSEERFGKVLAPYRKRILLSTKVDEADRDVDKCKRQVETSLKRFKTDYLDLLMIHSIEKSEDIAALENGLYRELVRLKEQGVARFIGFSSMNSSAKSREMLEKLDLDVCILAMNPTKYGDFAEVALPVARQKNVGVIAMKVMRDLVGKDGTTAPELMKYALMQPGVATAVIGHYGMAPLEENVRLAKLAATQEITLDAAALERRLARYASPNHLCWARPDYRDGMIC